ncbi:hypothetical protein [Actinotalea fermentans]|uniref:Uncharacterized protein n=1 Tax=Actinotalea fermentans TaxID=43671 RepID=A0A511YZN7_9CELL|nr:hypothetical protein [Actinotalea fermentans]KGM16651.1 hypothetical protein N867_17745 [Actinotalea fermentans ATCC 43279 = JCM 9966 = DSM 3133]GEN80677.1 hypothetical protein AFE02nite_24110 [Actinotalea fermentans]
MPRAIPQVVRRDTPRPARVAATTGAAVVGALALTACGPGEPPADPPLDAIRAQIEAARPDPRLRWDAVEERTAACMAEQGFEYHPVPSGQPDEWRLADPGDLVPGTREFAEQYGYGVLTLTRLTPPEDETPDPNIERLMEMSPGELPAYTTALWGPPPAVDSELGLQAVSISEDTVDPEADLGCHGDAERAVDAGEAGLEPDVFAQLSAEMTALDEETAQDPRLDGVNARWAACMLDAGHPDLERVGDGEDAVLREVDARLMESEPSAPEGASVAEMDGRAHRIQLDMAPFEIELALADLQCRDEVGYAAELASVSAERQAEFVAEHRAELDAWLAAATEDQPA